MTPVRMIALAIALFIGVSAGSSLQAQEDAIGPIAAPDAGLRSAPPVAPLPLSNSPSVQYPAPAPLSFAQQQARFEAEQRTLRMAWNNWIGYSPLRPNMNASYMSNGLQQYYIPSRAVIVSTGHTRSWYW